MTDVVRCEACGGHGGLRYEPGLLVAICDVCHGTGVVDKRPDTEKLNEFPHAKDSGSSAEGGLHRTGG